MVSKPRALGAWPLDLINSQSGGIEHGPLKHDSPCCRDSQKTTNFPKAKTLKIQIKPRNIPMYLPYKEAPNLCIPISFLFTGAPNQGSKRRGLRVPALVLQDFRLRAWGSSTICVQQRLKV